LGVALGFAVLGTFMKLFGFFNIPDPWTLKNWKTVLTDDLFLRSLVNTVVLATSTAVAAVLIHSLIAYIVVRTRYRARQALDVISWLPFTVPGIILGLALLWLFLDVGFLRPMYGTMAVLVTAGLVSIAQRKFEEAMVVACIIMAISLVGALVARVLGLRGGLG